ncbi:phenylacetate--CoA ligase family protein [Rhodopirellula sp. JC639]|uniref:phenylacetate--CoA ligase family protein n=1 Tax=Stieleria mannarensis TaxID=2755585 RepID=UPI0015FFEC51|nr:phenylacetate--CoA ligase family protein [Rhodopirellula sp. JC639]
MLPVIARANYRLQERMLGRRTFAFLDQLEERQRWPQDKLKQLQFDRLKQIVTHAYEKTEYWRTTMERQGLTPSDLRSFDDLYKFPLLDKETVRAERERMVDREGRRRLMLVRTSGSTNEALQFYADSDREAQINAARIRGHRWVGINKGDREMYFWGSPIELSKQDHIKRFRDWLINDGLTNGFEIKPELVKQYFEYWMRWRPKCIFGYPNSLMLMALMSQPQDLDLTALVPRGLEVICTTSEMLTDVDRDRISKAFGVPVFDSYGLREAGLIGHECKHQVMHTMDDQLLLETIDPQTSEPTEGEGELVVTSIYSTVMPMIRYRTGDVVTLSSEPCRCGLSLNRLKISGGRVADFVITTDGRWIPGYAFIYICRSVPGVIKFQVRQDRPGEIRVVVATDHQFPNDGIEQIASQARDRLQSEDRVTVEVVEDIQPARSGKYRPVVSRVAEQALAQANES